MWLTNITGSDLTPPHGAAYPKATARAPQPRPREDFTGRRFGRLTVTGDAADRRLASGRTMRCVSVVCDCGTRKVVLVCNLLSGSTKGCGCLGIGRGKK